MDVRTRQSYIVAVVKEEGRIAAAGFTNISRNVSQAVSPSLTGYLLQELPALSAPFVLGGALKIAYDIALYLNFRNTRPADKKRVNIESATREPFYSPCNPSTRKVIN